MTDSELKTLKDNLWHAADVLRAGAHLAANKYGQPILGLIFLRYADILYKQHKVEIEAEYNKSKGTRAEKSIKDISIKYCGFYLPPEAYYTTINDAPDDANKATLVKKAMEHSDKYTKDELIKNVWGGVKAMVLNKGEMTNEQAFWKYFTSVYGEESLKDKAIFDDFYANEFEQAKQFCGKNEDARKVVDSIKEAGFRVVLATNPVFPEVATRKRASWAGFNVDELEAFKTNEN